MLIEGKKAKANRVVLDAAGTRIMILIIQISTLVGEVRKRACKSDRNAMGSGSVSKFSSRYREARTVSEAGVRR